jgi:hypothetical protein
MSEPKRVRLLSRGFWIMMLLAAMSLLAAGVLVLSSAP